MRYAVLFRCITSSGLGGKRYAVLFLPLHWINAQLLWHFPAPQQSSDSQLLASY
jgi:hypothetical protein